MTRASRRPDLRAALKWLVPLLLVAFGARLYVALSSTYVWDEDRDWIVVARSISFDPSDLSLPIRRGQHPALPAYLIRAGAEVAGENPVGYRLASILAGVASVGLIALAGLRWGGPVVGFTAGTLLALNEYHTAFSTLAMARIFYLTFVLVSILAFARFLETERPRDLYLTMVAAALAFLCKETAALLLPIGAGVLLWRGRRWFRRPEPYLAGLLFLALISPDLLWQLLATPERGEAGYADHLGRIGGVGITYQPWVFFGRDAVRGLLDLAGRPFLDTAAEYPTMNPVLGSLLLAGAAVGTWRARAEGGARFAFLAAAVWFPLAFFSLVQTRSTAVLEAPVAWNWADMVLLPAVLLTASWIGRLAPKARRLVVLWGSVGVVWYGLRLIPGALGFSPGALGVCPDDLVGFDGRFVPVRATIQGCATCGLDDSELVLEDVFVRTEEGPESLVGTDLVRGAEIGENDLDFELRAVSRNEGLPWFYHVTYAIPGRIMDGRPVLIGTSIQVSAEQLRTPRFWACTDAGASGAGSAPR